MNCSVETSPAQADADYLQSAMFQFPGRRLPLARRLAVHNRVTESVRRFLIDRRYNEVPVPRLGGQLVLEGMIARGFPAVWGEGLTPYTIDDVDPSYMAGFKYVAAAIRDLTLDDVADLQIELIKTVTGRLSAELLGGRQVTRLDRTLSCDHPRLTYKDALKVLNERGWDLVFGDRIHSQAQDTLTRHCGNLPVLVTHLPVEWDQSGIEINLKDPSVTNSLQYILPYAGLAMTGAVRSNNPELSGGRHFTLGTFGLEMPRLLQFLMGVESILDAVINPLDRGGIAG